jgi:hypothetical protein
MLSEKVHQEYVVVARDVCIRGKWFRRGDLITEELLDGEARELRESGVILATRPSSSPDYVADDTSSSEPHPS